MAETATGCTTSPAAECTHNAKRHAHCCAQCAPTAPGDTADVCGESDSWGGGAPGTASEGDAGGCREGTWSEAQAACAEIGARLCTADEACPR